MANEYTTEFPLGIQMVESGSFYRRVEQGLADLDAGRYKPLEEVKAAQMETDEQGVLTEAEIARIVPGNMRNDHWLDYQKMVRAQHDHDVVVVKGMKVDAPPSDVFYQGFNHAIKHVLAALKG